ncbi:MAG: hypothetical protein HKO65_09010, partial [Gemmatimonadetes bacterium]|nr:hypothetical protein [Gemmatimonadota bacterium]
MGADPLRIDFPGLDPPDPPDLRRGEGEQKRPRGASSVWAFSAGLLAWALGLCLFAALPFFALIRTSVYLFDRYPVSGWTALGGGVVATVVLLLLYLVAVSFRFGGKGRVPKSVRRGTALLVGSYCLFALIYLSSANAKTEEVRSTYTALAPILRVATSTLLLVDREGVLTDTGRTEEDYRTWGIPVNDASLHLPQADGYVYAVDIRTLARPEWRNRAVSFYFRLMGFETLRHVGTADHLHVSLDPSTQGS